MPVETLAVLCGALFGVAVLYSSVGHAGASGYIAVMTLLAIDIQLVRPTALSLNILVAAVTAIHFYRAGFFSWQLFWPFALGSVPLAYFGGSVQMPAATLRKMVGVVLLLSALRLLIRPGEVLQTRMPPVLIAICVGGAIGLLSGLTGTGGGIFLTPILLLSGWALTRQASAVTAFFILANSAAGLFGYSQKAAIMMQEIPILAGTVFLGGAIGSYVGSHRLPVTWLRRLMALVLTIAGTKLLLA